MPEKKSTYHHGDLRAALIQAADEIIAEGGLETFSLRAAAKRAGVSPGAPAHHFGSVKGLLTEVALLAFERMGHCMEKVERSDDATANVRALALAFVTFAVENPGHFRLMFRNDLVNRSDPRYQAIPITQGKRLDRAIAAYQGRADRDGSRFEDAADVFGVLATLHGMAHLLIEEKGFHAFQSASGQEFLQYELPQVLERLYPRR